MATLRECGSLDIDWELAPEDAVTMYLEWGNNNWHSSRPPVRSRFDESIYFVVDTWEETPVIRLIRRNSEASEEILSLPMPADLLPAWRRENGTARGVFAPGEAVTAWLKEQVHAAVPG
ncbi:conserved hypothetical protein [uncultured delta proteobacterium]|uniref:Uncharacterized protein n=1 Tax=uncultured delta proteobacterium TaxID=34034 RepID=A0A212J5F6_9DELT|nr:conserved hypothetical protein [uncultured delta proteobacterium]